MRFFSKILILFLTLYLIASIGFSIAHAVAENPWDFRQNRNGLLCIEITENDFVIYSPFCNYADVFLLGIAVEEQEDHTE